MHSRQREQHMQKHRCANLGRMYLVGEEKTGMGWGEGSETVEVTKDKL